MTLSGRFLAASGSVTGRLHRRAERDGQDGAALVATDDVVAAIVTDGCSSGRQSEIGARLGAAWLASLIRARFATGALDAFDERATDEEAVRAAGGRT